MVGRMALLDAPQAWLWPELSRATCVSAANSSSFSCGAQRGRQSCSQASAVWLLLPSHHSWHLLPGVGTATGLGAHLAVALQEGTVPAQFLLSFYSFLKIIMCWTCTWLGHTENFRKYLLSWKHKSFGLGHFARSPEEAWIKAS